MVKRYLKLVVIFSIISLIICYISATIVDSKWIEENAFYIFQFSRFVFIFYLCGMYFFSEILLIENQAIVIILGFALSVNILTLIYISISYFYKKVRFLRTNQNQGPTKTGQKGA